MKKLLLFFTFFLLTPWFTPPAFAENPLRVVASFSIIGDMIREIGGGMVQLTVLAGPDADMHTFQPNPNDAKALKEADIIVINGLGLEGWMDRLLKASGTKAKLLVASAGVKPFILAGGEAPIVDPHAWQSISNGRLYVRNIANALMAALPEHSPEIRERFLRYDAKLKELDRQTREQFASIPREKRKIVTTHDAFNYFGEAYGVTFISLLGISTEAEPSSFNVADLIKRIKAEGIKTVFFENMTHPGLMEQIAREAGVRMGGALYTDALSPPDGPAPIYIDMLRFNTGKIKRAIEENG